MHIKSGPRLAIALFAAAAAATCLGAVPSAAAGVPPRVDLGVLVVTDGTPWVEAIHQQLTSEGVPTTVVNLADPARPAITAGYLADALPDGTPHAHFQGVVLPGDYVPGLSAAEQSALAAYEAAFSVRQVDSYVYPNADVGMNPPTYAGTLDATRATATGAARSDAFRYLSGSFTFEGTAGGGASYGYLGQPLPNTPTATFTPMLTETIPGTTTTGTLAGEFTSAGRQVLEISFGYNYYQLQFRHLAHGVVDWVTRGVHFGYWRNYLDVHIDDVFNSDAIWSAVGHCTPGADTCPAGTPDTTPARMTDFDVVNAYDWELTNNFTLDLLFNGGAEAQFQNFGFDPTLVEFQALANQFRWVNHTFTHQFLGCVQDFSVIPWRCVTDANGNIVWADPATINGEITDNLAWAKQNGIPVANRGELVAGEHSGTLILPQQPVDNPNFDAALGQDGVRFVGLDASREPAMRPVGAALGLPRHPVNVFYNVSTLPEEISEYNWIYTSRADGGSGLCENSTTTSCIAPLDPNTGWSAYILPTQVHNVLGNVLENDPRPFYMHQSNLTDDRLALSVVGGVLSAYRAVYTPGTPVVNGTMTAAGQALSLQGAWAQTQAAHTVAGYVQGNTVTVTGPAGTQVPLTVPGQTRVGSGTGPPFGTGYAGERSAYATVGPAPMVLVLAAAPFPGA